MAPRQDSPSGRRLRCSRHPPGSQAQAHGPALRIRERPMPPSSSAFPKHRSFGIARTGWNRLSKDRTVPVSQQGDPVRNRHRIPFKTRRSSARRTPRGLFGGRRDRIDHSRSATSYRRRVVKGSLGNSLNHDAARQAKPIYEFTAYNAYRPYSAFGGGTPEKACRHARIDQP